MKLSEKSNVMCASESVHFNRNTVSGRTPNSPELISVKTLSYNHVNDIIDILDVPSYGVAQRCFWERKP